MKKFLKVFRDSNGIPDRTIVFDHETNRWGWCRLIKINKTSDGKNLSVLFGVNQIG